MSKMTDVFSSLALVALLALTGAPSLGAEPQRKAEEPGKKSPASQDELERKLAEARKRLDEAAREVANLSMSLSDDLVPHLHTFGQAGGPPRAMLGINLGSRDDAQTDGVEIVSVSPGGAAEGAGLKAGDVLTDVNGAALKRDGDESAREKLLTAMRKVKPGDSIAVSYRREGKVSKTNLVAQSFKDRLFTMAIPGRRELGPMPHMSHFAFMRAEGVFGSAELVALTPKLGQYFGTQTGLLVVRAPEDSRLKLEDGDVIVDIDGRTPSSASHALRILSSYQPGEKLKLNILRAKKRMSFDVTVPEDARERRMEGARFEKNPVYGPVEAMPALPPVPPPPPEASAISIATPLLDDPV